MVGLPRSTGLVLALLLGTIFAGCGGKDFEEGAPTWSAGYRWEWNVQLETAEDFEGTLPGFLEGEAPEPIGDSCEQTERLEIFNTSVVSTEGFPLYAGGLLTTAAQTEGRCRDLGWEPVFFTRQEINPVEPVHTSYGEGVVSVADDDDEPRPTHETRLFRFPLRNGESWTQRDSTDLATTTFRVVKQEGRDAPAGHFEAIRLFASLSLDDQDELEDEIRAFFRSQGASLDQLEVDIGRRSTYWYSGQVAYLVEEESLEGQFIHAAGTDDDGKAFDFTYRDVEIARRQLTKYEHTPGPERPLSFLNELVGYEPPPITPLAHFVAEVVADQNGINAAEEESAVFGIRIFNTTAGEKRLRPDTDPYAAVGSAENFDRDRFSTNWTFSRLTSDGLVVVKTGLHGATVQLSTADLGGPGRITAEVTLIDKERNVELSSDQAHFEVYWAGRLAVTATADNATQAQVYDHFGADAGVEFVRAQMEFSDANTHPLGSLRVYDAAGLRVSDESGQSATFFSEQLDDYATGSWQVRWVEPGIVVGTEYRFDVDVGYRPYQGPRTDPDA